MAALQPDPIPAVDFIVCCGDGFIYFLIDYDPEWGILASFAEALHEHARCVACAAPPQADFSPCPCGGGTSKWRGMYRVNKAVWKSELEFLRKKDRRRVWNRNQRKSRREAIQKSDDPSYSSADIALLRSVQNDACYYCGTSISENFQVEHLDPLTLGGSNGIGNIMLACPACNQSKWTLSEAQFWRKLRKRLPAPEFERVRESAKVMKREKRRRLRESG